MRAFRFSIALRIALIYLFAAGLWILVSDRVIELSVEVPPWLATAQTSKGLIFVGVTALLLYLLLRYQLLSLERAQITQERYARRMEILHLIDQGIIQAQSLRQIADAVLNQIRQMLSCQYASIAVIDLPSHQALVFSTDPSRDSERSGDLQLASESGWIDALGAGQIIVIDDARLLSETDYPIRSQLVKDGMMAFLIAPLMVHQQLIGTLNLASNKPGFFIAEYREIAKELADQLAITVQQFRLKEELAQHATDLEKKLAELKQAEQARRESETRYHFLFENMLNGFAYCQMYYDHEQPIDFSYIEVNSAFETLTGLKNVTGKKVSEIIPGIRESDPSLFDIYGRVALTGVPEKFEMYVEALEMWFSVSVYSPKKESFVAVFEVITERKRAEKEIRWLNESLEQRVNERTAQLNQAKNRIEAILNSSSDVIILCRPDGTIDQVNPAFDAIFSFTSEEFVLQPLSRLVSGQYVTDLEQAFETVVRTRQSQRLEITAHVDHRTIFDADMVLSPIVERHDRLLGVICSLRDISAQKQMEAQLRQMLQRESELSELKSRYVSMAAHDLRNPLAVIQSATSMIHHYSDRLTAEQKEAKYSRVESSIQVMVSMLDDILTIGQAEAGKLKFDPAPLDLIDFCQNLIAELKQVSGSTRQIKFSSTGNCNLIGADARLLWHILDNLLSNALKYSPDDSMVDFTVDCELDRLVFRVRDQGIGIPQAEQARLFEAFHRASNARQVPGTGLGLTIVKLFVELHGGTITYESNEGQGTTFTVTLPHLQA